MAGTEDVREAILLALMKMDEAYGVSVNLTLREAGVAATAIADELQRKNLVRTD